MCRNAIVNRFCCYLRTKYSWVCSFEYNKPHQNRNSQSLLPVMCLTSAMCLTLATFGKSKISARKRDGKWNRLVYKYIHSFHICLAMVAKKKFGYVCFNDRKFSIFNFFYHRKRLQMEQKLMAAVNRLSVIEFKWPLQNKFGFALAFVWAIKRQDRTVCYRDIWVAKVRTICA